MEGSEDNTSRGMYRPCAYAIGDTAQNERWWSSRVSKRKKCIDDLRKIWKVEYIDPFTGEPVKKNKK